MTVSKHVVSAIAQPAATTLAVAGGSVALDVTGAPFVQGTLRVKNKPGLFDALDPRAHAGTVSLVCGDEIAGTTREFSLNIRSVRGGDDNTLEIALASDEALLEDYSPAADTDLLLELNYDETVGTGYGNITASELTGWVLDQIGGTLVAPPSPDPQLEPYWEVKNLAVNPVFYSTIEGAAAGAGATSFAPGVSYLDKPKSMRWVAAAGGARAYVAGWDMEAGSMTALPISAERPVGEGLPLNSDKWLWISTNAAVAAGARSRRLRVEFRRKTTGETVASMSSDLIYGTGWGTVGRMVNVPSGDWYMTVSVEIGATSETTLNAWATDVMIAEVRYPVRALNGSTFYDSAYEFAWDDTSNDSPSTRYPYTVERRPEAFTWPAGQGGLSFLAPLLQTVGLRLVHNGLNEWTLRHSTHVEPGTTAITYGDNMIGYDLASDLETFYDAAAVAYKWTTARGERTRTDYYEATPNPRRVRYLELAMAYPGPGRAENIVRRAQTGGRVATATTVTQWDTTPEQALTIETSIDGHLAIVGIENVWVNDPEVILTGTVGAVTFNLDDDTMTVVARRQEDA